MTQNEILNRIEKNGRFTARYYSNRDRSNQSTIYNANQLIKAGKIKLETAIEKPPDITEYTWVKI